MLSYGKIFFWRGGWRLKVFRQVSLLPKGSWHFHYKVFLHPVVFTPCEKPQLETRSSGRCQQLMLLPVAPQHHSTIRACYKAGMLLSAGHHIPALPRGTRCPVHGHRCKIISRSRWLQDQENTVFTWNIPCVSKLFYLWGSSSSFTEQKCSWPEELDCAQRSALDEKDPWKLFPYHPAPESLSCCSHLHFLPFV